MILVDASVWVEFLHRQGSAEAQAQVSRLIGAGEAAYCGVVELELLAGARTAREEDYIRMTLDMCVRLVMDEAGWATAGHTQFQLARKGKRAGLGDLLIATVARAHGVVVLTRDADFERIRDQVWPDLKVEKLS